MLNAKRHIRSCELNGLLASFAGMVSLLRRRSTVSNNRQTQTKTSGHGLELLPKQPYNTNWNHSESNSIRRLACASHAATRP